MAIATNLFTTFGIRYPGTALTAGGAGIRENVSDVLENIDPEDTPSLTAFPTSTVNNLFSDWMVDGYDLTSTAGALEGDEFSAATLRPRARLQNWVQRFRKDFALSQDQIELARRGGVIGIRDAWGHEAGRAGIEVRRNINARLWNNSSYTGTATASAETSAALELDPVTGTTTSAALMGNLRYFMQRVQWVNPSNLSGTQTGTLTTGSQASASVAGAIGTASLYALSESLENLGVKPNKIFMSPGVKVDLSRALLNDTSGIGLARTLDAVKGSEYGPVIEVIRTDFHRMACVVDRYIPQLTATAATLYRAAVFAMMDTSKVRVSYWRQLKPYSLPPSGDNMRGYMLAACTLEVSHPNAIGYGHNVIT